MKRILIANWESTSEGLIGGCEIVADNLQKVFKEAGYKVEMVTFKSAMKAMNMPIPVGYHRYAIIDRAVIIGMYLEQYEEMLGVDMVIGFDGCLSFYKPKEAYIISYLNNPYKDISEWVWDRVNKNEPQAVANYLEFGNVYPMLQERDLEIADVIVTPSKYMADYYRRLAKDSLLTRDPEIIPHGIDTDLFKPMDKSKMREKHLNDRANTLTRLDHYKAIGVWNGGFHPVKNWDIMAELIRKHQDIFWIVIMKHPGVSEPRLKNVKLFHNVPYETVPELFNCADFYISVSQFESFGLCGIEAMACNIPIISTRTGMWLDWTENKKIGCFPRTTKIEDISRSIKEVIDNRGDYIPRETIFDYGLTLEVWKKKWINLI